MTDSRDYEIRCVDCGVDTCLTEMGPRAEEYIVHDEIWAAAGIPKTVGTCASDASKPASAANSPRATSKTSRSTI
jgi:hypothetical protein